MKKLLPLIVLTFFIVITSSVLADNDPVKVAGEKKNVEAILELPIETTELSNSSASPASDEFRLGIMNIQIDPLGILFFGPQLSLDFQFANLIAIGPDFTWHYAGLLYQLFITDFFSDGTTLGIKTYGIGGHIKFLIPAGSGQHRPYVGFGYEKFFGEETANYEYEYGIKYSEYKSDVFRIDLGYRLITEGSFNLSAGLTVAISRVSESLYYFESDINDINYYEPGEIEVFPMIQLVLGWQIGK